MTEPNRLPNSEQPKPLSANDAAQLAGRVAELAAAELPLAPGLRAAAAELNDGRLPDALRSLAAGLERGQTLEQSLVTEQSRLPPNLRGLVAAGVRSGRLGEVLEQFVAFRQFVSDMRRSVWLALAYPLLLLAVTAALFLFLVVEMTPLLKAFYQDAVVQGPFNAYVNPPREYPRVPANLRVLEWFSSHLPMLLGAIGVAIALLLGFRWICGAARARRVLNRLPAIGSLWRFSGLAEFAQLLRLLIEHGIPLGEALRLAADGIGDADLAAGCRRLAERVEAGQSLSAALEGLPQFEPIEQRLIAWGESHGTLAAALETTAAISTRRLRIWSELLRRTMPAVILLVIAAGVFLILSFFQSMLSGLGWFLSLRGWWFGIPRINFDQPAAVVTLIIVGAAVLISLRILYPNAHSGSDALHLLLQIVARILLAAAVFGFCVLAADGLGLFLWIAAMIVWGMIVFRLRRAQQRMLIDVVALSARRGLPLGPVVEAFAGEQRGIIARRAERFAERLEAGCSVAESLRTTPRLLPAQDQLAVEIGQQTDSLPVTLGGLGGDTDSAGHFKEQFGIGAIGLLAVGVWGVVALLFYANNVVPAIDALFLRDFHRPLPPLSQHVFACLKFMESPGLPLEILFGIVLVILGFYLPMYEMGWTRAELPLLRRFFAPRHAAVVLRWLAAAVRRQNSLLPTISTLAIRYPSRLMRSRLRSAAGEIELGGDWIDSFRRRRLIGRTDVALLRAASRAGNLAWAIEESAAGAERRLTYRLQTISQILMPLAILLVGGCVMLFAAGGILPLVTLISELATK